VNELTGSLKKYTYQAERHCSPIPCWSRIHTCLLISRSFISAASLSANFLLHGSNLGEGSNTGPLHSRNLTKEKRRGKLHIGQRTIKKTPRNINIRFPKDSCLQSEPGGNIGGIVYCDMGSVVRVFCSAAWPKVSKVTKKEQHYLTLMRLIQCDVCPDCACHCDLIPCIQISRTPENACGSIWAPARESEI
jgi:hypothetical protein